jgi:hypothetical protein
VDDLFWYATAAVDWASYPTLRAADGGPRNSVPAGFRRIDAAQDLAGSVEAQTFMLDAVGRDQSKRLFPVLVPAMSFLLQMAVEATPWSRVAAIEVVTEVLDRALVEPAEGLLSVERAQLVRHVRPWQHRIQALESGEQDEPVRTAARDLLEAIAT